MLMCIIFYGHIYIPENTFKLIRRSNIYCELYQTSQTGRDIYQITVSSILGDSSFLSAINLKALYLRTVKSFRYCPIDC